MSETAFDPEDERRSRAARQAEAGDLVGALEAYERLLTQDPSAASLWSRKAEVLVRLGRTPAAVAAYRKAARQHLAAGEVHRAVAAHRLILKQDPDDAHTRQALAQIYDRFDIAHDSEELVLSPAEVPTLQPIQAPAESPQDPRAVDSASEPERAGVALSALKRNIFFSALDPEALVDFLRRFEVLRRSRGEYLIREGEIGEMVYVLVEGQVEIRREDEHGASTSIATLEEGSIVGEIAALVHTRRTASVVTTRDSILLGLPRAELELLRHTRPEITQVVRRVLVFRLLNDFMRANAAFATLGTIDRLSLVDLVETRRAVEGLIVVEAGRATDHLFLLIRGECAAFTERPDGSALTYPTMYEGDLFGEISLLGDRPATATVVAQTDVILACIPREGFSALVSTNAPLMTALSELGAIRLERTARGGSASGLFFNGI